MQIVLNVRLCLLALAISAMAFAFKASGQEVAAPVDSGAAPQVAEPAKPVTQMAHPDPAASSAKLGSSEEHQQGVEADTKRLYQLALELRTEVGKTYKQSLSLAVLKKAEELERLAKSLKAEMDHEASAKKR
jgi:hypothetical protein